MKIFITRKIHDIGIKMLQDAGFEVDVYSGRGIPTKKDIIKALKKKPYNAVLSLLTDTIDKEVFDACPTAKIFANYSVGFNNVDLEEAKKRNIYITNAPGVSAITVAEHTIALILTLARRILEGDRFVRKGKFIGFQPMLLMGENLVDKTLGIIGTGAIGGEVARIASKGFNMNVMYYDIAKRDNLERECNAKFCSLEEILRQSDFVSLHVPLNKETKHLMNKSRLEMMKDSAYLINTSRGAVIDELALIDILKSKKIKGAGLDVFEFEPKISRKLRKLENVVLTPHIASSTELVRKEIAVTAAKNIIETLRGNIPPNKVN